MASVLGGLLGGGLGAVGAVAVRRAMWDAPGTATMVWAKYLGDGDAHGYEHRGVVVDLLYGTVAGGVFAVLAGALRLELSSPVGAFPAAVGWAAVLGVVAVGFWWWVAIGKVPRGRSLLGLVGAHLVYGVVLGAVVGLLAGI